MKKKDFLGLCKSGDVARIQEVFDNGYDLNEEFLNDEHDTRPLCHAKNSETAQLLIDNDTNGSLFEVGLNEPAIQCVISSVARGYIEISSLVVSVKYDQTLNQDYSNLGFAIHCAVRTGNIEIVSALLDAGVEINLLSNDGESAIGIAAKKGDTNMVQFLIENGSGVEVSDFFFADSDHDDDEEIPCIDNPLDLAANDEVRNIILQAQEE